MEANQIETTPRSQSDNGKRKGSYRAALRTPLYTEAGIRISPAMLSGTGLKTGDQFRLTVEDNKVILWKQP